MTITIYMKKTNSSNSFFLTIIEAYITMPTIKISYTIYGCCDIVIMTEFNKFIFTSIH